MIVKTPRLQRPVLPCNRLMNTDAGEPPNRGFDSNFNIILFIVRQCSTYVDRERIYKYVSIKLKNYEHIILLEAIHVGDRRKERDRNSHFTLKILRVLLLIYINIITRDSRQIRVVVLSLMYPLRLFLAYILSSLPLSSSGNYKRSQICVLYV